MKKTKYYCDRDHCGKEVGWDNGYTDYDLPIIIDEVNVNVDVCEKCLDEYIKYTKDFFEVDE